MGQLLRAMRTEPIIAARNAPRGTQLKLLLTLAGKQKVIFKPKWYEADEIIPGVVYSGKDRHRAELVAFYLGAILNLRWTPIAVGRRIDLRLVEEKADRDLRNTITTSQPTGEFFFVGCDIGDDVAKCCVFVVLRQFAHICHVHDARS